MADNKQVPAAGTGSTTPTIATDEIAGVDYQRVKVTWGVDGVATDASASNPLPVALPTASTATLANISGSASSVTLISANAARLGFVIVNDSTAVLDVKYGSSASATSLTYILQPGATLDSTGAPFNYTGIITGIWASATGAARCTELTA